MRSEKRKIKISPNSEPAVDNLLKTGDNSGSYPLFEVVGLILSLPPMSLGELNSPLS